MQTTLLGIAIAMILALVAALGAPLVVDWNEYRAQFEERATALIGLPVRIGGPIDARILPSPQLKLHSVEVGPRGQAEKLRVGAIAVQFELGPLLRGELRASDMRLIEPEITVGLNKAGRIEWPRALPGFRSDALSVARLHVEQGRIHLADGGSASRLTVERFSFSGEVRSLAGPFRGEGGFSAAGDPYTYKLSTGRIGDDGLKLRLHIDASRRPMVAEADGALTFANGAPQFDGTVTVARPVAATLAGGQRVISDPWRISARVKAQPTAALFEQVDYQYGPDERAIKLGGTAELKLGERPRLDGVFSARQIDFDRALAGPDTARRLPLTVLRHFVETLAGAPEPPLPIRVGIGVDAVTLGGTVIQSLRGDIAFDAKGWDLDRIEFRAPGSSLVSLSGRIDVTPQGVTFRGPAAIDAADMKPLVAWLEGRSETAAGPMKALRARGDVTIGHERFAIERLRASLDRETVEGRLAYTWAGGNRPARLEAAVGAADLDLDAILAFANATRAATAFELPREIALSIEIGRATFGGVEARRLIAEVTLDSGALQIGRLSVSDFGGATVNASGRIEELSSTPRGQVVIDLDARSLTGVASILGRFSPQAAEPLRRYTEQLAPAKLRATLNLDGSAGEAGTTARIGIDGRLGAVAVNLSVQGTGKAADMGAADLIVQARFDSEDGGALVRLARLDRLVAVDTRPAQLTTFAHGRFNGNLRFESRIVAGALDAAANGSARIFGDQGPTAGFNLTVVSADARPLRRAIAGRPAGALPVELKTRISIAGSQFAFDELSGKIADSELRGRLSVQLDTPAQIGGEIEVSRLDVPALIATATGTSAASGAGRGGTALWSPEQFAPNAFADLGGSVRFKADQAVITPALVARATRAVMQFTPSEVVFDEIEGTLAGGRLGGRLAFRQGADGMTAQARMRLTGADPAAIDASGRKGAVEGRLDIQFDVEGTGLSPATLVGSLSGKGAIALQRGRFSGLDANAFDVAMRIADQGRVIDTARIQDLVAGVFDGGKLGVGSIEAPFTVNAGQVRMGSTPLRIEGGDLAIAGVIDLMEGSLDGRVTLTGPTMASAAAGSRPAIVVALKGPIDAPKRTLDVSSLTAWLALRAADQQTRQLEAIEVNRRMPASAGPVARPAAPAVRSSPPGTASESGPSAAAAAGTREAVGFDVLRRDRIPARAPGDAVPEPGDAPSSSAGVSRMDQAPPLPAPIEIRPAPGSSGLGAPRAPARAENAPVATEAPKERKPARPPQPAGPRPPLDLLVRP